MKVLHICSYYIGNKLYKNLVGELSEKAIDQEVFVPIRKKEQAGVNQLEGKASVRYYFPHILKGYHRYFYFQKIRTQERVLENQVKDLEQVDLIHAHTIFSDGGTAYRLYKKYGIPYVLSVRGTDINHFYRKGLHLRPFMYRILKEAREVVFISHAYRNHLLQSLPKTVAKDLEGKARVIPNGIEDHWLTSPPIRKPLNKEAVNGLYIGALNENKNVETLLKAAEILKRKDIRMTLHLIGSGPREEELKALTKKLGLEDAVVFHGYITDPERIRVHMRECDLFMMVSQRETFGLVYVEAMSQGLPVIYSRGQGFDGFFEEGEVGYSADSSQAAEVADRVERILENHQTLSKNAEKKAKEFNWERTGEQFADLYQRSAGRNQS